MSHLKDTVSLPSDPTINDDNTKGFSSGFRWINTISNELFVTIDDTTGAAVWITLTTSLLTRSTYISMPLRGVTENELIFLGECRTVTAGESGDFATDFGVDNQHVAILVNTIVTGGDIVLTGDSVDESTGVVTLGDTETITIDTTAAQHYQTSKKWWVITNVDITTGTIATINYDIIVLGYSDLANTNYKIVGYRLDAFAQGNTPDINFSIKKIQDDGDKKMSFVELENIGVDSNNAGDQIIDSLRTGGADRSYDSPLANLWEDETNLTFKQDDFDSFFSSGENEFQSSTEETGFYIQLLGSPSGGISEVDYITLRIDYKFIA